MKSNLLNWHFSVQKGMYFDEIGANHDFSYFLSKVITDPYWNYAFLKENNVNNVTLIKTIESIFKAKERIPCIYLIDGDDAANDSLCSLGYSQLFEESFMVYNDMGILKKRFDKHQAIRVSGEKEIEDFMSVFISAYGGEKTPEQPYGELDETYYTALLRSFSDKERFYHFICYYDDQPVSVASLCFNNEKKGGIYNVGTVPQFRGQGFGSSVTNECIRQWRKLGGDTLFLQTETGSLVEELYQTLGFESIFVGRGFVKE